MLPEAARRRTLPLIDAGLKHPGARKLAVALAFEVVEKEREFDLLAIVDAGLGAEADLAHAVAIASGEASVSPGPMTRMRAAGGECFSMKSNMRSGPCRSSASNHPPTVSTAGLMPSCVSRLTGTAHTVVGGVLEVIV